MVDLNQVEVEIKAIKRITAILSKLSEDQRQRVMAFLKEPVTQEPKHAQPDARQG